MISKDDKLECARLSSIGYKSRKIYEDYYIKKYPGTSYDSFSRMLRKWKKNLGASTDTLQAGTYPNFTAHGATVQVNSTGEVVQAWIKQHGSMYNMDELIAAIKDSTHPALREAIKYEESDRMLELPLYDLHFPMSDYQDLLDDFLFIISNKRYDEINLIIGQDLFHNDDFRGRTSSGRSIEKLDMISAWRAAEDFWYNIISYALDNANKVNLIYSKGNHDETLAWAFVQRLAGLFPDLVVDDTMKQRKCIYWDGCFIGITHGHMKKNHDAKSLRSQFTIEYPQEFAQAKVREIHAGHLHHEEANDLYGVTVRRLSSAVPTDEWSDDEGYVGAHKRFMIFEYAPGKLKSIHFI